MIIFLCVACGSLKKYQNNYFRVVEQHTYLKKLSNVCVKTSVQICNINIIVINAIVLIIFIIIISITDHILAYSFIMVFHQTFCMQDVN